MPTESSPGARLSARLQRAWYEDAPWLSLLYPLSWLTAQVARRRRARRIAGGERPPVPVLVVGNVTVGGTGKTPLVIALCEAFTRRGIRVGVISRGYGARPPRLPWAVTADQSADVCGDEPLLIVRRTGVPMVIDPRRRRALDALLAAHAPQVVISDDGLQHAALPRSREIVVLDGRRLLGNGRCLPAGPLREPAACLDQADWLVINGPVADPARAAAFADAVPMTLEPGDPTNLLSGETLSPAAFAARFPRVSAVAGIGHPARFGATLDAAGIAHVLHAFPDHHRFVAADFDGLPGPVLMTEKDAVKCTGFATRDFWYLPVRARLPDAFIDAVVAALTRSET